MKEYDWLLEYPTSMKPGKTLILKRDADFGWFENNLLKTAPYYQSNYIETEQHFVCNIVGYVSTHVDSYGIAVCFDDKDNYKLVVENHPEWILEKDPFKPDPVEIITIIKDGKEMTRWDHFKQVFKF